MYVAPTPYALAEGTAHARTLIVPRGFPVDPDLVRVGELIRREVEQVSVGYTFNLKTNLLTTEMVPNPGAGREHLFDAFRLNGETATRVVMRSREKVLAELAAAASEDSD